MGDRFATLRGLMQQERLCDEDWSALFDLARGAWRAQGEEVYQELWIPYMRGFPQHFGEASRLSIIGDARALEEGGKLFPFAMFSFCYHVDSWSMRALRRLARSAALEQVKSLSFLLTPIGDDGVEALSGSSALQRVETLSLKYFSECDRRVRRSGRVEWRGVRALARDARLERLARLELSWNEVTDRGMEEVLQAPWMEALRELDLLYCWLTDKSAHAIASSPACANLTSLRLSGNHISKAGIDALLASPCLRDEVKAMLQEELCPGRG